jgi:hypothetical protein
MKEHKTFDDHDPIPELLNELWVKHWGYPLQWSLDLSKLDSELGQEHKRRLQTFNKFLEDKLLNTLPPEKK